jgi:hypothetical protein
MTKAERLEARLRIALIALAGIDNGGSDEASRIARDALKRQRAIRDQK